HEAVAPDLISRSPLDGRQDIADQAARHRRDRAAALAADVLVMVARGLVPRLAVVALHPLLPLEAGERAEDRGEVGPHASLVERGRQLVDRPAVPRALGEKLQDRRADVAGTRDPAIIAITQVACETVLEPGLARGWWGRCRQRLKRMINWKGRAGHRAARADTAR